MQPNIEKLAGVTSKIKTPLALSGFIVAVLYAIYRQVLSLQVFENIGANPTFLLLQNVLDKLFWLALAALVLGVSSYVTTVVLGHRTPPGASDVTLLNASFDPHDSPYEQQIEDGRRRIRPKGGSVKEGDTHDHH